VGSEDEKQLVPGRVDRQAPGSLGVGLEFGEPRLGYVAVQRQVGFLALDRPLDRGDTDAESDLDPVDPGAAQGIGGGIPVGVAGQDDGLSGDVGGWGVGPEPTTWPS
jgi:hypothetical protein